MEQEAEFTTVNSIALSLSRMEENSQRMAEVEGAQEEIRAKIADIKRQSQSAIHRLRLEMEESEQERGKMREKMQKVQDETQSELADLMDQLQLLQVHSIKACSFYFHFVYFFWLFLG